MKRCELEMENDSPRLWGVLQCIRAIFGKKIVSRGQEERNGKREMRHNRCFPPEAVTRELKMERHFPKDAGNLRPPPISLSYSFFTAPRFFCFLRLFFCPFQCFKKKPLMPDGLLSLSGHDRREPEPRSVSSPLSSRLSPSGVSRKQPIPACASSPAFAFLSLIRGKPSQERGNSPYGRTVRFFAIHTPHPSEDAAAMRALFPHGRL